MSPRLMFLLQYRDAHAFTDWQDLYAWHHAELRYHR